MASSTRITLSIPTATAEAMASIARRLHISRSALIAELLAEPIAELEKLVDLIPHGPTSEGDVKRFRGASIELIGKLVAEAQEAVSDLDPEPKLL